MNILNLFFDTQKGEREKLHKREYSESMLVDYALELSHCIETTDDYNYVICLLDTIHGIRESMKALGLTEYPLLDNNLVVVYSEDTLTIEKRCNCND